MADKKADKVLTMDTASGGVELVDASAPAEQRLKRSFRGGSKVGYTSHILIDGHKVFIREMTREEFLTSSVERDLVDRALQEVQDLSVSGNVDNATLKAKAAEAAESHASFYLGVIQEHVKGWELPDDDDTRLPFTPEILAELPLSVKVEMTQFILQKSQLGKDESTF